ncbi:MAG: DAK2 domain-containing protein [Alicyclobacillaceae bacterium]|nr:DAK2 domain-containing protein [Alicyclobacillaceae bacterium]
MRKISELNMDEFRNLLGFGHASLQQHVAQVNAQNVFPVPDGDTGTNMEMSYASGMRAVLKNDVQTLPELAKAFAEGLLMGARGNSGVILSQLCRGFQKGIGTSAVLTPTLFAQSLEAGVAIAYRAVSKPVEGTILTVAREAAAAASLAAHESNDFCGVMDAVVTAAKETLSRTPELLPVLRQAGVVDSGGQGFVFLCEGFLRYVKGLAEAGGGVPSALLDGMYESLQTTDSKLATVAIAADSRHEFGEFGYCTEVLVRVAGSADAVARKFRDKFSKYGDSLVVVAADTIVRVHVHTLHPGKVLEDALTAGSLLKVKVENMTEQHRKLVSDDELNGKNKSDAPAAEKGAPQSLRSQAVAVISAASGAGFEEVFTSLGVAVVRGIQAGNPSTEEWLEAVAAAGAENCILLPNNKNVWMAAEQVPSLVKSQRVVVIPTLTPLHGIEAAVAYLPEQSLEANVERMTAAVEAIVVGQVAMAVKDTVYQDKPVRAGEYLGLLNDELQVVGSTREEALMEVARWIYRDKAELMTIFCGESVSRDEQIGLQKLVEERFPLSCEVKEGGQPVFDYLIVVE